MSKNTRISSTIRLSERTKNTQAHQAANASYFPCFVIDTAGITHAAFFTTHEIEQAMDRAVKNHEDVGIHTESLSWFARLFG